MLTPQEIGGGSPPVFPYDIKYSVLLTAYSSTGVVATNCDISFGFKPVGAVSGKRYVDETAHYIFHIGKTGTSVTVRVNGGEAYSYTGTVGSSYAEFVQNVLTDLCGTYCGYYAYLNIVESNPGYESFGEWSDKVTGLWMLTEQTGMHTTLDFSDAAHLGWDRSIWDARGEDFAPDPRFVEDGQAGGWSVQPDGWDVGGGEATMDGSQIASKALYRTFTASLPQVLVVADIVCTAGAYYAQSAGSGNNDTAQTESRRYYWLSNADTITWAGIYGNSDFVGSMSRLSLFEITGPPGTINDWTVTGEQTIDTPTDNFPVLNPFTPTNGINLSDGNLTATGGASGSWKTVVATMLPSSGKYYAEYTVNVVGSATEGSLFFGVCDDTFEVFDNFIAASTNGWGFHFVASGEIVKKWHNEASVTVDNAGSISAGSVVQIALDVDEGKVWFGNDNVWIEGNPAEGTGESFSGLSENIGFALSIFTITLSATLNFGATGFTYVPPAGFSGMSTRRLRAPQIFKSSTVADIVLRNGSGNMLTGGTASGSAGWDGTTPAMAFDGSASTTHEINYTDGPALPQYTAYEVDEAFVPVKYALTSSCAPGVAYLSWPTSWVIQGSNDGSTWTDLDSQTGQTFGTKVRKEYTFSGVTSAYSHYRIKYTASHHGNYVDVGIFEVFNAAVVSGLDFQPDFINMKDRDAVYSWMMFDAERGAEKYLTTDRTNAQATAATTLTSFNPDGYALGSDAWVNAPGDSFVDLCLKAGQEQGFEIVTYTGSGVARPIAHGLNNAPTFMIVKRLDAVADWRIYHVALGASMSMRFLTNEATENTAIWNDTEPTATQFTVGTSASVNANGGDYIAYLFTDSDLFKAFSFTGNGSIDGPFVHLGGHPLAIPFLKNTSVAAYWMNHDTRRNPANPSDLALCPDDTLVEATWANAISFTSQGMKVGSTNGRYNGSGNLVVGLAIFESTKYTNGF